MAEFRVVLIAVDDYPDPPGPLPSSESARRLGALLSGEHGGDITDFVTARNERDVIDAVRRWADAAGPPPPGSLLYLVGHGAGDNTYHHDFHVPTEDGRIEKIRTSELAKYLVAEGAKRKNDPDGWALFILDCCDSDLGVSNLNRDLELAYAEKPRNLACWPVAPEGAARTGAFVDAFERALKTFTENDERIDLHEVYRRIREELGNLEPRGFLPREAALTQPVRPRPAAITLDVREELRRAINSKPVEVRSHFLAKAQGSEENEVAWHFAGRDNEIAQLNEWLHVGHGMQVVTGEAGSGKSALLGHMVVLADSELVEWYTKSKLAPHLAESPKPPENVFDAMIHLTGKTAIETLDAITSTITDVDSDEIVEVAGRELNDRLLDLTGWLRSRPSTPTVLVDALDESQDPLTIASLLHVLSVDGLLRVLVGTRKSVSEGPDQPSTPDRRDLLDALNVTDDEVLVVEQDSDSVKAYAQLRLLHEHSPYAQRPADAAALAASIASREQPFLFARLATAELLARPAVDPGGPEVAELLENGHRGVFAAAVDRITAADPRVGDMLNALAHARGRGMPQAAGVWVSAAQAIGLLDGASEDWAETSRRLAAPYIALDAEAGQSTYRLAHQTFVEHFHVQPGFSEGHRRIANTLLQGIRSDPNGWAAANYYPVRYLTEHLVADAERTPPEVASLSDLVADAGWLTRAVGMLGSDRTIDAIAAATAVTTVRRQVEISGLSTHDQAIDAIERTLRRSRVVLSRDPAQLPAVVHARLHGHPDASLSGLGKRLAATASQPWLRMTEGQLNWASDLESTRTQPGKARGVALGHVDGRPVIAIGIDDKVYCWDPRQGVSDAGYIDVGVRPTAVAIATVDGQPVIVTSAAYDSVVKSWDARNHKSIRSTYSSLGHAIAVGRIGKRVVIAGGQGRDLSMVDADTLSEVDVEPSLRARHIKAWAVDGDRLLAIAIETNLDPGTIDLVVLDPANGSELWRSSPPVAKAKVHAVAGGTLGSLFVIVANIGEDMIWATEGNLYIDRSSDYYRSLAVGMVEGRPIAVMLPHHNENALVQVRELQIDVIDGKPMVHPRQLDVRPSSSVNFEVTPVPNGLRSDSPYDPTAGSFDQTRPWPPDLKSPETWPHFVAAKGEWSGKPIVVTGSIEGAIWVWTVEGDRLRSIGGPFVNPSRLLNLDWSYFFTKPGLYCADSIALGDHPVHGPIVALACGGEVSVYTIPDGTPVPSPTKAGSFVKAVGLGSLGGRIVMVTGSRGGKVTVWDLANNERVAALTLDDPVSALRIADNLRTGARIAVRTRSLGDFLIELTEPQQENGVYSGQPNVPEE
jgi:WD40 repeat protein